MAGPAVAAHVTYYTDAEGLFRVFLVAGSTATADVWHVRWTSCLKECRRGDARVPGAISVAADHTAVRLDVPGLGEVRLTSASQEPPDPASANCALFHSDDSTQSLTALGSDYRRVVWQGSIDGAAVISSRSCSLALSSGTMVLREG